MENAALTSHQTVSAISASEANEIGLYSGDVISLSVEKKESLSTANSAMAMAPTYKTLVVSTTRSEFHEISTYALEAFLMG